MSLNSQEAEAEAEEQEEEQNNKSATDVALDPEEKLITSTKTKRKKKVDKYEQFIQDSFQQSQHYILHPCPKLIRFWKSIFCMKDETHITIDMKKEYEKWLEYMDHPLYNQLNEINMNELSWINDFCILHDHAKLWMQQKAKEYGFHNNPVPIFNALEISSCKSELIRNIWFWYRLLVECKHQCISFSSSSLSSSSSSSSSLD
jgi:hypothetical protein